MANSEGQIMKPISRRHFLKTGVAAGSIAAVSSLSLLAEQGKATDLVTLGNSGVKVTRLAFGTGTNNGQVQRQLGQAEFTKLVRYAYDQGIRAFNFPRALAASLIVSVFCIAIAWLNFRFIRPRHR